MNRDQSFLHGFGEKAMTDLEVGVICIAVG